MRLGDLSNEMAPATGFRFEGIIKTADGHLNSHGKGFLMSLMADSRFNCYLVTTKDPRKAHAFCLKWGVPYSSIIEVVELEIPDVVRERKMVAYWDMDKEVLLNVNARVQGAPGQRWISEVN